jgi:sugar/nucleoside kinase (ribokinase family)
VLSEEDLAGNPLPDSWRLAFDSIIVTRSRNGLHLYRENQCSSLAAFPALERDPTGAGDALAAAFLIRFGETHDAPAALRFSSALASFVVEAPGLNGIPTREQVEQRLRDHPEIVFTSCL